MTHAELHNSIPTSPKVVPLLSRIASKLAERSMHRQADIVISHTCDRGLSDMGLSRESLHCIASDAKKRTVKDASNNPKRGIFRNPF